MVMEHGVADTSYNDLVHYGLDITVNAFSAMEDGEYSMPYINGVRDGIDALLAKVASEQLSIAVDEAYEIVGKATKECMEMHQAMHEQATAH